METDDIPFLSVCQCCVMLSGGGNMHIGEQEPRPPPVAQWPPAQPEQAKRRSRVSRKRNSQKRRQVQQERMELLEECCSG